MHLYIIRHGESLGNIQQSDHPNCGLSPQGEEQVQRTLPYFENIDVSLIFSSPLKRTIQSAIPLAEAKGLQISLIPELAEVFDHKRKVYGVHSWDSSEEVTKQYPRAVFIDRHHPNVKWWPVWPETGKDVIERVKRLYYCDLQPYIDTDYHIVVFGHGATTRRLRSLVCKEDPQNNQHGSDNAVICAYQMNNKGVCQKYEVYTDHIIDFMSDKVNRGY